MWGAWSAWVFAFAQKVTNSCAASRLGVPLRMHHPSKLKMPSFQEMVTGSAAVDGGLGAAVPGRADVDLAGAQQLRGLRAAGPPDVDVRLDLVERGEGPVVAVLPQPVVLLAGLYAVPR